MALELKIRLAFKQTLKTESVIFLTMLFTEGSQ